MILALSILAATAVAPRIAIVPRVDHHQHLVGPTAVMRPPVQPPAITLPDELARVLDARNAISGTLYVDGLYTKDAHIVDLAGEGAPWVTGLDAVRRIVRSYEKESEFVPTSYALDGSVAEIDGYVRNGNPPLNFTLGLRKEPGATWRIAVENATLTEPRPFAAPRTADDLIEEMDIAGVQRAVVLSVAYWFGSPTRKWPGDEYANVKAENDWTAAQVAKYPDRLVAFCGVSPIKDYAVTEIRRCASELHMKGIKLHFRSSHVDILNPEHLAKVREVFRVANELKLPIVIHTHTSGAYGHEHAEAMLNLMKDAPDVPVQIAHLWGGNDYAPAVLATYADAIMTHDPRAKNLYFDLTEVALVAPPEALPEIAQRIRQIGLQRVFYGSDVAATENDPSLTMRWALTRHRLPLTDDELRVIANNVAPYLR